MAAQKRFYYRKRQGTGTPTPTGTLGGTESGSGTTTKTSSCPDTFPPSCGSSLTVEPRGAEPRIWVIDDQGSGAQQTWTVGLQFVWVMTTYFDPAEQCDASTSFNTTDPGEVILNGVTMAKVTLKATGDPSFSGGNSTFSQSWTGTVTLTGDF
jgi:hypothetical protein